MNNVKPRMGLSTIILALFVSAQTTQTMLAFAPAGVPSYDQRRDARPAVQLSSEREQAAAELIARLPGTRIDYDPVLGTPAWISRMGFLSRSTQEEIERTGDLGIQSNDPHRAIKAFMIENAGLFEHGVEVLTNSSITREFVTAHNGMRTVVWQQELDGIPVFEATLKSHIMPDGRLVNISSRFLPAIETAASMGPAQRIELENGPPISSTQAVAIALVNLGEQVAIDGIHPTTIPPAGPTRSQQSFTAAPLFDEARAEMVWLPMNRSTIRLCWSVRLVSRSTLEVFRTLVDAMSGEVPIRQNVTCRATPASYRVFTNDSPSPFTPGWLTPSPGQPSLVNRQLLTLPYLSAVGSPAGWIPDGANGTHGNNVSASLNRTSQEPNPVLPPQGSPFRVFDFPLDLNQDPVTYGNASVVNLFYWCNFMHDKLYDLGFTEAAGNFQDDNFGRGGLQLDRIIAYAQFDADDVFPNYNNAFFQPDSDGHPGKILMLNWDGPTPHRDGDLDAELIIHEYTHGMSTRLVGVDGLIGGVQSLGLGEGWSDFYALAFLSQPNDDANGNYAFAGYSTYLWSGLTQNYYYGRRRYPYTRDLTKNPLTFKDIDPDQADPHSSVALSPNFGPPVPYCDPFDENSPCQVHFQGQVWCVTLWEARRNMVAHHGYVGNQIMLQLVTDGMLLCPPNPNFIQARDAFFEALMASPYCGEDWSRLWEAFSKRGMGRFASAPDSSTTSGVVESFAGGPPSPCQD